uniref:Immunoglobulin V-set domain-containing protein n=1 Tax=Esox lucius TaxID=8010 RepID=A0AAY5KTP4_ESOLU
KRILTRCIRETGTDEGKQNEENCLEGTSVTLSYKYSRAANGNDYFYWYRQEPAPQFILWKGAKYHTNEHIPDNRYISTTSGTSTELVIQHLTLSDTALYYCALGITVIQMFKRLYKNLQIKMLGCGVDEN